SRRNNSGIKKSPGPIQAALKQRGFLTRRRNVRIRISSAVAPPREKSSHSSGSSVILCAPPLQRKLGGKRDAKTRKVCCSNRLGVGVFDRLCPGLQKNQRDSDRVRGDPVSRFDYR